MENLVVSALMWTNIVTTDEPRLARNQTQTTHQSYRVPRRGTPSLKKRPKNQLYNRVKQKVDRGHKNTTVIFAPHPDDAILCCALEIRDRIKNNQRVKIVYITNGDGKEIDDPAASRQYGKIRQEESRKAMRSLGLKNSDLLFLNFPDGHLAYLKDKDTLTSQFTGQDKTSPQSHVPNTDYTWLELKASITDIIRTYQPEQVFIPHANKEQHWDHREVGRITQFAIEELNIRPVVSQYTIHEKYQKQSTTEPNKFKLNLIQVFQSQFHNTAHQKFLEQFAQSPEHFDPWENNKIVKGE